MKADDIDLLHAPSPTQHDVVWTPDRIRRFWDFQGSNSAFEDTYFSKFRGRALIDFVSRRVGIGLAFDMGCGRGDLIGCLLDRYQTGGADQSPGSVAAVNDRFGASPRFRGATVGTAGIAGGICDTLFIVEVVEHLNDETLASVLKEAHRLLKPGGHLVLTTPNREDLGANAVICPECACVFHRWQHIRSWTPEGLEQHVQDHGFQGKAVPALLSQYHGYKRWLHRVVVRVRGDQLPHMIYIGRRCD